MTRFLNKSTRAQAGLLSGPKLPIFLTWMMITSASPFMFYAFSWHPYKVLISSILAIMLLSLYFTKQVKFEQGVILVILAIQCVYSFFCIIFFNDFSYVNLIFQFISILIMYLYIENFVGVRLMATSVVWVLLIMGVMGAFAFILAFLGILSPLADITYSSGSYDRHFFNYLLTFTNVSIEIGGRYFIRVAGYFNEPGALAYYIVQAILINRMIDGGKWKELVLIVTGLFTVSLAFVLSIIVYIILFNEWTWVTKKTALIGSISIILCMTLVRVASPPDNQVMTVVSAYTVDRLSASEDENGIISGDNRTEDMKRNMKYFWDHPIMGLGNKKFGDLQRVTSYSGGSIVDVMIINGSVGFFIYFMHYIYLCFLAGSRNLFVYKDKTPLKVAFILGINYIQRPYAIGLFNYILIILMIVAFGYRQKMRSPSHQKEHSTV